MNSSCYLREINKHRKFNQIIFTYRKIKVFQNILLMSAILEWFIQIFRKLWPIRWKLKSSSTKKVNFISCYLHVGWFWKTLYVMATFQKYYSYIILSYKIVWKYFLSFIKQSYWKWNSRMVLNNTVYRKIVLINDNQTFSLGEKLPWLKNVNNIN